MHPHNIEGPYIKQNKHLTEVEGSEHIPGSSKKIHQKIKKINQQHIYQVKLYFFTTIQRTRRWEIWTDLHEVPCKLAITFPELIEGEVHAAVVDQVPGDGQGVSLRNALLQQAFTENYHDALPVTARYLRRESLLSTQMSQ